MPYILIFLIAAFIPFVANASNSSIQNNDICHSATRFAEQKYNIPKNLLRAIALTESGRWQPKLKENIAWPWTVTSGGPGAYFASRAKAIQHVKKLQAEGRKNIDVGCMQINLHFHPTAFKSLPEAFDPYKNAEYAAKFLSQLFKESKSWTMAAGKYHSRTPTRGMGYREKVLAFWNFANDKDRREGTVYSEPSTESKSYRVATIDHERTNRLNNSFRNRLNAHRAAEKRAAKLSSQISQYRVSRGVANAHRVNAARQKALYNQKQKKNLTLKKPDRNGLKGHDFSTRRSAQLDKWRQTIANPELFEKLNRN